MLHAVIPTECDKYPSKYVYTKKCACLDRSNWISKYVFIVNDAIPKMHSIKTYMLTMATLELSHKPIFSNPTE